MTQKKFLRDETEDFRLSEFKKEAVQKLKEGKPLGGEDGIIMPLIRDIINASLEAEIDSHITQCKENQDPCKVVI